MGGIVSVPFFNNCRNGNKETGTENSDVSDCEDCLGSVAIKSHEIDVREEKASINENVLLDCVVEKASYKHVTMQTEIGTHKDDPPKTQVEMEDISTIKTLMDKTTKRKILRSSIPHKILDSDNFILRVKAEIEDAATDSTYDKEDRPSKDNESSVQDKDNSVNTNKSVEAIEFIKLIKSITSVTDQTVKNENTVDQNEIGDCDFFMKIESKIEDDKEIETCSINGSVSQDMLGYENIKDVLITFDSENIKDNAIVNVNEEALENQDNFSIKHDIRIPSNIDREENYLLPEAKDLEQKGLESIQEHESVEDLPTSVGNHSGHDWVSTLDFNTTVVFQCKLCDIVTKNTALVPKCRYQSGHSKNRKRVRFENCKGDYRNLRALERHSCEVLKDKATQHENLEMFNSNDFCQPKQSVVVENPMNVDIDNAHDRYVDTVNGTQEADVKEPNRDVDTVIGTPEADVKEPNRDVDTVNGTPEADVKEPYRHVDTVIGTLEADVREPNRDVDTVNGTPEADVKEPNRHVDTGNGTPESDVKEPNRDVGTVIGIPEADVKEPNRDVDTVIGTPEADVKEPNRHVDTGNGTPESDVKEPNRDVDTVIGIPEADVKEPKSDIMDYTTACRIIMETVIEMGQLSINDQAPEGVVDENVPQIQYISRASVKKHNGHDWWNIMCPDGSNKFKCTICNLVSYATSNVPKCTGYPQFNTDPDRIPCNRCDRLFKTTDALNNHNVGFHRVRLVCQHCNKTIIGRDRYERHLRKSH